MLLVISILLLILSICIVSTATEEHYAGNVTIYREPTFYPNTDYVCQSGGPIGVNMCNYA